MFDCGLNKRHLNIIKKTLNPYAENIDEVGLFGSRATAKYNDYSDIDMVLYGNINDDILNSIWTLFDESSLPVTVDVVAYDLIDYPPLKSHINNVAKILFTNSDIK